VVGTRALKEPDWFRAAAARFPGKLALGIDAKSGRVATHGWLETSDVAAIDLARELASAPIAAIIYTDISRDGMLQGPNLAAMAEMKAAVRVPIIASGGVTTAKDVADLARLGMDGCIIGRALYEGTITLTEAISASHQ
jgi:phosphoribosylformimino-5-aminoimidazole carboxamide ribotide isomerase